MGFRLVTVEDIIRITGRGFTIVGIELIGDQRINVGDQIELRRADGTRSVTMIAGISFVDHISERRAELAIMLPPEIGEQEVPVGTEIWVMP